MNFAPKSTCRAVWTALFAAISFGAATAVASSEGDGEIRILAIVPPGTVQVLPSGASRWVLTTTNETLAPGDRLRTGPDSLVRLIWSDRSIVSFGARTEIEILPREEKGGSSGLNLLRGLMSFFHRDEPGRIQVRTKGANAGVDGTELVLSITSENGKETTQLSVIDGTVQFTNDLGSVTVTNNQQAIADEGTGPRFTAGFIANNVLQWTLYYPAVLDLRDLPLSREEKERLRATLNAYASGDLLAALEAYPIDRSPASDAERVYYSALLLSVGQVSKAEKFLDELAPDEKLDRLRRLVGALRTLIAAVKLQSRPSMVDPELPTEFLAASYYEQSRATGDESLKTALVLARRAANQSADFGFAYARVAELELSFGRREQATEALRWARSLTPRNAHALAIQGFVLTSENKTREAIEFFNQALAVDPALGNAWMGRGLCRIRRGDVKGGREDLLVAAAMEPQRAILRSYLAKAYADAGRMEEATDEIRLAKELDPKDPTAWLYSALINQQENRINQAIKDLEASQELNNNRRLFRSEMLLDQDQAVRSANLASVYRDAGMNDVAVREAAKAVTYDYANSSAHLFMSDSYNELRDPTLFNLRYETVWFSELLLANLLAPVGAVRLSQTLGQLDNVHLFESDRPGLASSTFARSDGQVQQLASQFGTVGNTAWALDLNYRYQEGVRINSDLDAIELSASVKQQITPEDSVLLMADYFGYSSGDNFQYYYQTNAQSEYRFDQRQEPALAVGYHHEWSPGIHTLLLGGWVDSQANASDTDPQPSAYYVRGGVGGNPDFLITPSIVGVEYETETKLYSGEFNQIVGNERVSIIAGVRIQGGTVSATDVWTSRHTDVVRAPPTGSFDESLTRLQGYTYLRLEPVEKLWLTGGVSYEDTEYPAVSLNSPVSAGSESQQLLGPKAAIVWNPARQITLRGMYSRSLAGYSLEQSFRLEPSQLAGFPQVFRSVIPQVGATPGAQQDIIGLALDIHLDTGTYLGLQANWLSADASRDVGIWRGTYVPPLGPTLVSRSTTEECIDYEEKTFSAILNQTVGKGFVVGASYRFADAAVKSVYPELGSMQRPPGASEPGFDHHSYLHRVRGTVSYNHPFGFFSRFDANYYQQSNTGFSPDQPGDSFVQLDLLLGYRFARRHAEFTFGILNLTDSDYRLEPLTYYSELPRERVFAFRLNFQF